MTTAFVALLALGQEPDGYPLRVNVAERQEYDYELSLPGRPRPVRQLYTVARVQSKEGGKNIAWRVEQFDRDAEGRTSPQPVQALSVEFNDRNKSGSGKSKTLIDQSSFGASDQARKVGRLVLGSLFFNYPIRPVYVGRTWEAALDNPFVKGAKYQIDYKLAERLAVHSWDCYRIDMASSLSIGYGGKELTIEGTGLIERSTGMPVTVDLRVIGADGVSESLNRTFRIHLTRDKDEK